MRFGRNPAILLLVFGLTSHGALAGDGLVQKELVEKSGIGRQVQAIPDTMRLAIEQARQQGAPIDNKFASAWAEAVPVAYDTGQILGFIDQGLQKLLTAEERHFLLAHYDSDLGRRITALEIAGTRPEAAAEMQAYAQELMADPSMHSERLALYQELDKVSGATTMAVDAAMNTALAIQVGLASALHGPRNVDINAMRAAIEQGKFALTQQLASTVLTSFAYIYRDLSKDDLLAYLTFLNAPAAKKFNVGVGKLISEVLTLQTEQLGRQIAQNLGRKGI